MTGSFWDFLPLFVAVFAAGGGGRYLVEKITKAYAEKRNHDDQAEDKTRSVGKAARQDKLDELWELVETYKTELKEKNDDIRALKREISRLWEANAECERSGAVADVRIATLESVVEVLHNLLPAGTVVPRFASAGSGNHPVAKPKPEVRP